MVAWFGDANAADLFLSVVTIGEIELGISRQRLAERISKHGTGFLSFDRTFHGPGENGNFATPSALALHVWNQRSIACAELKDALTSGSLEALYFDRSSGHVMKFEKKDWLQAAFFPEILRGGIIRSSVGESIARADGRRVLIDEEAFARWLRKRSHRRPAVARQRCAEWLRDLMRVGSKTKSKASYQDEAFDRFGTSGKDFREFGAPASKTRAQHGVTQVDQGFLPQCPTRTKANCILASSSLCRW